MQQRDTQITRGLVSQDVAEEGGQSVGACDAGSNDEEDANSGDAGVAKAP